MGPENWQVYEKMPMGLSLNVWFEAAWFKGSDGEAAARPLNVLATGGSHKASQNTMLMSQKYIC